MRAIEIQSATTVEIAENICQVTLGIQEVNQTADPLDKMMIQLKKMTWKVQGVICFRAAPAMASISRLRSMPPVLTASLGMP